MPLINDTCLRERIVTARKGHWCDSGGADCKRRIAPGEKYLLCTEYPGGDAGYADFAGHPVRMRVCARCCPRAFKEAE